METNITSTKAGLKYGVYAGIILLLYSLAMYVTGIVDLTDPDRAKIYDYLPMLITAVIMVLAIKYFKENNEGFLNIGEGIITAIVTGLIGTLISIIWVIVYFYIIDPEGMETLKDNVIQMTVDKGDATEEQMESMKGFFNVIFSVPAFAIISLIYTTVIGLVVGLITSLIMKNSRDN